jgi:hypothetical protein
MAKRHKKSVPVVVPKEDDMTIRIRIPENHGRRDPIVNRVRQSEPQKKIYKRRPRSGGQHDEDA